MLWIVPGDFEYIILGLALAGGACLIRWIGHLRYMRNVRRENPWFYGGYRNKPPI